MKLIGASCTAAVVVLLTVSESQSAEYGVDVSWPMHYSTVSTNYEEYPWNKDPDLEPPGHYKDMVVQPLGDRQKAYDEFLKGCEDYYGEKAHRCRDYERDRIEMTLRQPQSMENYTDTGFKKIRAPEEVWSLIKIFWDRNQGKDSKENWPAGNTYTNHWAAETRILNIEHDNLRGGGKKLKQAIWDAAKSTISEWTQAELMECSLYGIRIYTRGSILSPHVDRLPLVSSAIINVAADVEEPWPLEVIGHDGRAVNVTMEPGDMVLYESHSVIHGRVFPLKGNYVANVFIHFEPKGHSARHNAQLRASDPHKEYKENVARGVGGHEASNHGSEEETGLPPYILPHSPEVANFIAHNPGSLAAKLAKTRATDGGTAAHMYAAAGELGKLSEVVEEKLELVSAADANGWTPLHEGARAGSIDVVKYLLSKGADVNHRTGQGKGYSALAVAHQIHGPDHPISKFIESVGGLFIEPEL